MIVVVPMAGRGSRLASGGYGLPKPLVPVAGKPMLAWVLESLAHLDVKRLVCVALAEHARDHAITELVTDLWPGEAVVDVVDEVTDGQLCTVLAARQWFEGERDVLICPCDTVIDTATLAQAMAERDERCAGIVSVTHQRGEQWSFVRLAPDGGVVEVAEKRRISDLVSTGFYHFASGRQLVELGDRFVSGGQRTRGEYFVIPVYGELVEQGARVEACYTDAMWDLGTPEGVRNFERRG